VHADRIPIHAVPIHAAPSVVRVTVTQRYRPPP
jgi:hypothetical protein